MKTLYAAAISRLGMSQPEAAAFHAVPLQTIKNWASARARVPTGAWDELRALSREIDFLADQFDLAWEQACDATGGMPGTFDFDSQSVPNTATSIAAADFALSLPKTIAVNDAVTAATAAARAARLRVN
jgi:hypothetical protein